MTVPMPQIFGEIFKRNIWRGDESRSGQGSDMIQTEIIRRTLPELVCQFGVKTMLDVPCGDFNWMKTVDLDLNYIGGDIVPDLVDDNSRRYQSRTRCFRILDACSDELPSVDLVLCRDMLVHLSFADAMRALTNMRRSGSKYLLTTTFTERRSNNDVQTGQWRPLNLGLPPFNFPAPLMIIKEGCTEWNGAWADKCLGLWLLTDIRAQPELALNDD
jgi:hypothetical protein